MPSSLRTVAASLLVLSPTHVLARPLAASNNKVVARGSDTTGTAWALTSDFRNLAEAFAISSWAWGQGLVKIVDGVPLSAWAPTTPSTSSSSSSADATASPSCDPASFYSTCDPSAAVPSPSTPARRRAADPKPTGTWGGMLSNPFSALTSMPAGSEDASDVPSSDVNNGTAMQVLYPKGSQEPSSPVVGGVGFYAQPLDVTSATNLTFSYSVFFPADFSFADGGMLPGLYGGHPGCTDGSKSDDCFSSSLMWRSEGLGELYLYIPRHQQVASLCQTPPMSVCNTDYGLSIGRGAFTFTLGGWTTIEQTIVLNTPGVADGSFAVSVNGQLAISHGQVYFRHAVAADETAASLSSVEPEPTSASSSSPSDASAPTLPGQQAVFRVPGNAAAARHSASETIYPIQKKAIPTPMPFHPDLVSGRANPLGVPSLSFAKEAKTGTKGWDETPTSETVSVKAPKASASAKADAGAKARVDAIKTLVGFQGIQWNSFFDGRASPRDQHVWFNRAAMRINDQ